MAIVVSDTSPLRALEFVEQLDLLRVLFHEVVIPPTVAFELREPARRYRPIDVDTISFLRVVEPRNPAAVLQLQTRLDRGESEALVLATELGADAVLMDESQGRRVANELGLHPVGTLGVLVRARQEASITEVKPLIDRLIDELGFFLSTDLYQAVLEQSGEI